MTLPDPGKGIVFTHGDQGDPETFTPIGFLTGKIPLPQLKSTMFNASSNDSAEDMIEYLPTWIDGGQIKFTIQYHAQDTVTKLMVTKLKAKTLEHWQQTLTDPGSSVWDFYAYVMEFAGTADVDNIVTADVTLQLSGIVTPPA